MPRTRHTDQTGQIRVIAEQGRKVEKRGPLVLVLSLRHRTLWISTIERSPTPGSGALDAYRRMPIARECSMGSRVQAKKTKSPKPISVAACSDWLIAHVMPDTLGSMLKLRVNDFHGYLGQAADYLDPSCTRATGVHGRRLKAASNARR